MKNEKKYQYTDLFQLLQMGVSAFYLLLLHNLCVRCLCIPWSYSVFVTWQVQNVFVK